MRRDGECILRVYAFSPSAALRCSKQVEDEGNTLQKTGRFSGPLVPADRMGLPNERAQEN